VQQHGRPRAGLRHRTRQISRLAFLQDTAQSTRQSLEAQA
jgi:hypothetical protein